MVRLGHILVEGDVLLIILAINSLALFFFSFFFSRSFTNCISNISLTLSSFQSLNTLKMFQCANFMAYVLLK
jgi:hypothetical protein